MADLVIHWDPDLEQKLSRLPGVSPLVTAAAQRVGGRAMQLANRAEDRRAGAYARSLHIRHGMDSSGRWAAVVATRHAVVLEYGWTHYRTGKSYRGKKILTRALRESQVSGAD
ncbi:hypothetical protein [Yinghuangia sp. YIM S09857]|uniref:hypothetical protein n=1 Tax=Yinghuangia sp. YIM S09857 TaxID=3436929 RepID=UPI003F52F3A4